ncbi:MAG: toll/interleukin-1 receptor domain-containing protein [Vitreimonas sp.]
MPESFRYAAFISYSSADARFAQLLHRALESYGVPTALGSFELPGSAKPNRVYPVFRDREELAAGDLGERIKAALEASGALIVVCSPNAARSDWVEKEIEHFAALGRSERVFAIIADSAPAFDAAGADATPGLFPRALLGEAREPLAADARPGKDGFRNAWLKLVAALIGVTPGQIVDRDKARRRRLAVMGAAIGAAFVAVLGYGGWQALRPVSLTACASDLLTFADPWGGQRFEVARVGQSRRPACAEDAPICRQEIVVTVFEGAYSDPDGAYNGPLVYMFEETPASAPCCWWDAAVTRAELGPEANGAELAWFARGQAPRLDSFPFSSIELDDLYASTANASGLPITRNPMLAESCRRRPLF